VRAVRVRPAAPLPVLHEAGTGKRFLLLPYAAVNSGVPDIAKERFSGQSITQPLGEAVKAGDGVVC
jgi:hypothetical protein